MQRGFTLIELIVVIVILGVIAVTAAPRFIDISDDAIIATTKFEAANFKTASRLGHGLYLVRQQSPIIMGDQIVNIDSESGWPTGSGSGTDFCVNLWNGLINSDAPITGISSPTASLSEGWNAFGNAQFCAYGKDMANRDFSTGDLPHFIYYIRDTSPVTYLGTTYEGVAGDVQLVHM